MELTEFVLARVADDEAEAREGDPFCDVAEGIEWIELDFDSFSNVLAVGVARVLAECQAKRQIMELHDQRGMRWEGFPRADRQVAYCLHDQHESPCSTLTAIALPYADHPDYDPAWRP